MRVSLEIFKLQFRTAFFSECISIYMHIQAALFVLINSQLKHIHFTIADLVFFSQCANVRRSVCTRKLLERLYYFLSDIESCEYGASITR